MKYIELKELGRDNGHVAFQIAKMEGIDRNNAEPVVYNQIRFAVWNYPQWWLGRPQDILYLWGSDNSQDSRILIAHTDDYERITEAVRQFNEANKDEVKPPEAVVETTLYFRNATLDEIDRKIDALGKRVDAQLSYLGLAEERLQNVEKQVKEMSPLLTEFYAKAAIKARKLARKPRKSKKGGK